MTEIETTMLSAIARVGGEMCRGLADANPNKTHGKLPCEYCVMKEVCRAAGGEDDE